MNLNEIKTHDDIKDLSIDELYKLADDIRSFIIDSLSKTGGHLSSNLGVVELTIALHYVFDSRKDKMIFDVGHQSYTHKILTGRADRFSTLRQYQGLCGFQKRSESESDPWEAGHSSTSLSAALGFAIARDLDGHKKDYNVIPIVGDAALCSGMSFEALNQIGEEQRKMIIILNDNEMSISQNVGAISKALTDLRVSKGYTFLKKDLFKSLNQTKLGTKFYNILKNMKDHLKGKVVDSYFFDELNIDYLGPIDGHNIKELIKVLETAKEHDGPIVIHVKTKKGKGYPYAEDDKIGKYHGVSKFDKSTGKMLGSSDQSTISWSQMICNTLVSLASENKDIVTLTPAMKSGSKLEDFETYFPERFFDCGIAEEHTLTMAAGLAANNKRPFVSIYSSFLQRAYDSLNHDICRMDLPVVIGIDRAGLVGADGPTHHGVFDISMAYSLPNLIIAQGKDDKETQNLLFTAFNQKHPFMLRIPRGNTKHQMQEQFTNLKVGSWERINTQETTKLFVITYGEDVINVENYALQNNYAISIINARFIKPLDYNLLGEIAKENKPIIIYETDMKSGGLSSAILEYYCDQNIHPNIKRLGIGDHFVEQGSIEQLRKDEKIDLPALFELIDEVNNEN